MLRTFLCIKIHPFQQWRLQKFERNHDYQNNLEDLLSVRHQSPKHVKSINYIPSLYPPVKIYPEGPVLIHSWLIRSVILSRGSLHATSLIRANKS